MFDFHVVDQGTGTFQGQADLAAESAQIQLGTGGQTQHYTGTIVR